LLDLFVLIALLALIITMLMPAVVTLRERANQTQCVANLRNIAVAAQHHAAEHRGYLPCAGAHVSLVGGVLNPKGLEDPQAVKYDYYTDGSERRPMPITAALSHYMGASVRTDSRANLEQDLLSEPLRRPWRCPSQVLEFSQWSQKDPGGWTSPDEYSSYAFNEAILVHRAPARGPTTRAALTYPVGNVAAIAHPSEVFLFLDGRTRDRTARRTCSVGDYGVNDTLYDFQRRSFSEVLDYRRHRRLFNVLFVDGHVQTFSMEEANIRRIGVSKGVFQWMSRHGTDGTGLSSR
jgi:prepilin-type processing-associated H-X9-DG protein